MRNPAFWVALIVVLASAAGLYFWWERSEREARLRRLPPQIAEVSQPIQPVIAQPEISHPLPQETEPPPGVEVKPLPQLDDSDSAMQEALAVPLGKQMVGEIVISKDIARRIVTTVDNLPRRKVAERLFPVKPAAGQIVTTGQGEEVTLSPANYARYTPYVRLAQRVDTKKLIAVYVHFYPLFQQAYEELGYPKKYFNDRLVEVIDDLLDAPDVQGPVKLVRPKVLYEFADAELEDLSAGQKVLVRVGPENAALIKTKLRELRREVVAETPAPHN
jgi:hypothetical protein